MTPYRSSYYEDADILEIFFTEESATASVYLTPDIILHFQVEERRPVSLIFNNFSFLTQPDAYGAPAFRLEVEAWPQEWRDMLWEMLDKPPLNEWIGRSSYHPTRKQERIPLATIQATPLTLA